MYFDFGLLLKDCMEKRLVQHTSDVFSIAAHKPIDYQKQSDTDFAVNQLNAALNTISLETDKAINKLTLENANLCIEINKLREEISNIKWFAQNNNYVPIEKDKNENVVSSNDVEVASSEESVTGTATLF